MKPLGDDALRRLRAAAALPDLTGTRYALVRELGRGGMGVVYLAEDAGLGRRVAVKVLHVEDVSEEAQTLARLEHPNIVPVYDFGELPDGRMFYVMKFVEGVRLDEWVRESRSLAERLRLFEKICQAVAFAHARDVVHRDLKPENIMVGLFGEVLIMDWGLAKAANDERDAGRVMGTEAYMAPEQVRGDGRIDARADVFALGKLLDFLRGSDGGKALESAVRKATAEDAGARYSGAAELGADVMRHLDGLPVLAHRESVWEAALRFSRHNRTLLYVVITYVLARFLIFFWTRR